MKCPLSTVEACKEGETFKERENPFSRPSFSPHTHTDGETDVVSLPLIRRGISPTRRRRRERGRRPFSTSTRTTNVSRTTQRLESLQQAANGKEKHVLFSPRFISTLIHLAIHGLDKGLPPSHSLLLRMPLFLSLLPLFLLGTWKSSSQWELIQY